MLRFIYLEKAGNAIMVGQSERKHKAAQTTIPDADTMRTIIATVVAVITALLLSNFTTTTPNTVTHNLEQAITEHVSAAPAEATVTETPAADKPVPEKVAEQPKPTAVAPQAAPASTCAAEITKYSNWNQNVAHNVMIAESGGDVNTLNDNPQTGDYSIGCFQINLLGANLNSKYRVALTLGYADGLGLEQMVAWLKNPANNVAMADKLYTMAGNWGDWKYTCQTKVQCY